MRKTLLCIGFLAASVMSMGGASAVEINVLSAGAVQEAEKAIADDFREATGNKVMEGRPHIVDEMKNGEISLVFNTTDGAQALSDSASIRKTALHMKIPYCTTMAGAAAVTQAIHSLKSGSLEVAPLQSYA